MAATDDLMFGLKNYGGILLSPSVYEAIRANEHAWQMFKEMQQTATFLQNKNNTTVRNEKRPDDESGHLLISHHEQPI